MKIQRRLLPIYALICALLWGTAFPAIKYVYAIWSESQHWDARLLFSGVRFMLAGLILMPLVRRGGLLAQLKKADLRLLLALALILLRPLQRSLDSATATAVSLFLGGLLLSLAGSHALPQLGHLLQLEVVGMTLYLAFVSAAAFVLWNRLAREFSVNILAGYHFLIPLAGVTLSTLLISNEQAGAGIYMGATLIVGCLVYVNYLNRKSNPTIGDHSAS